MPRRGASLIPRGSALIYGLKGDEERASAMSRMDLDQQTTEEPPFFELVRSGSPN